MTKVELKQAAKRREIIESAIPIISAGNFDEISVSDICKATGISVGTFYHYFTAKNDLLVGLFALVDAHISDNVKPLLVPGNEPENLFLFAKGWAEHVAANGIARSRLISAIEPADTDAFGEKREAVKILEEIMRKGQEKKQITLAHSPEELTRMFLLAMRGVTVDWSRHNGQYDAVAAMEEFMSLFINGLKP